MDEQTGRQTDTSEHVSGTGCRVSSFTSQQDSGSIPGLSVCVVSLFVSRTGDLSSVYPAGRSSSTPATPFRDEASKMDGYLNTAIQT